MAHTVIQAWIRAWIQSLVSGLRSFHHIVIQAWIRPCLFALRSPAPRPPVSKLRGVRAFLRACPEVCLQGQRTREHAATLKRGAGGESCGSHDHADIMFANTGELRLSASLGDASRLQKPMTFGSRCETKTTVHSLWWGAGHSAEHIHELMAERRTKV